MVVFSAATLADSPEWHDDLQHYEEALQADPVGKASSIVSALRVSGQRRADLCDIIIKGTLRTAGTHLFLSFSFFVIVTCGGHPYVPWSSMSLSSTQWVYSILVLTNIPINVIGNFVFSGQTKVCKSCLPSIRNWGITSPPWYSGYTIQCPRAALSRDISNEFVMHIFHSKSWIDFLF